MMRKLLIVSLLVLAACDPKQASVESKPFEESSTDGLMALNMHEPLVLASASWLFWKDHNDMAEVMRAQAAVSYLSKNLESLNNEKETVRVTRHRYILENLGRDNQSVWEGLEGRLLQVRQQAQHIKSEIEREEQRLPEDRDLGRIDDLYFEWHECQRQQESLQNQMRGIELQSGAELDFSYRASEFQTQLASITKNIESIGLALQQQQALVVTLAELVPDVPTLILQEKDTGLYIELVDFSNDGLPCSTDSGGIQGVSYNKAEGAVEFMVICKQPEGQENSSAVLSYGISLERIPNPEAVVLSGNMYRCTETGANGQCLVPVTYGVLEYRR